MRRAVLLGLTVLAALAGGCELEPGTSRPPPAVEPPSDGSATAGAPTPTPEDHAADEGSAAPAGAGSAAPAGAGSAAAPAGAGTGCTQAANHLADLQQLKPEQRDQYVRGTAQGCTRMAWSPAVIACIEKAKNAQELQPCSKLLRDELQKRAPAGGAPPPPPPPTAHRTAPPPTP